MQVEIVKQYAVISLDKPPVNSMNAEFWSQLHKAFTTLPKGTRAVIFKSNLQKDLFTAGNDINELYAPKTSKAKYSAFWALSNQTLALIYGSNLITICCINGYCPAGGLALGLCCDYRISTQNAVMGLNEVQLGIPVPKYWVKLLTTIIGHKAESMVFFAQMVSGKEALNIGINQNQL